MITRLHREAFRAMGTECLIAAAARPAHSRAARRALAAAREEIAACERTLSRFDGRSDLTRLNARAGEWVSADERLLGALAAALRAREATEGRFDPTILPALVAAGYDRTFEELGSRPARVARGWRAGAVVELDRAGGRARVERGAAADLGGIGKGFSASRAVGAMLCEAPELVGVLVDLGGDIAVWGSPPGGGPWRIAVADPRRPGLTLGMLGLEAGAVATSGRDRRRFGPVRELHHLIDPATGAPAAAGPLAVTVVAPDAAAAEAHATALAISTLAEARAHVSSFPELAALYVPETGEISKLGRLPLLGPLREEVSA